MHRILELIRSLARHEDVLDTQVYVQHLGRPVAETRVPKLKVKATMIQEDGNELEVNVTEIAEMTCSHWNVELGAICSVCSATYCKYCLSKGVGYNCVQCGRFICPRPSCSHVSIIDPEIVVCSNCGTLSSLPAIIRKHLCES